MPENISTCTRLTKTSLSFYTNSIMKNKILIVNGVNLSQLGTRETNIYGAVTFEDYLKELQHRYTDIVIDYYQSDIEGELARTIANAQGYLGLIVNAGAYTHHSIMFADAVRASRCRVIEVHISNLFGREQYRRESMLSAACQGFICGFGLDGYRLAVEALLEEKRTTN